MSKDTSLGFFKNLVLHGGLESKKADFHQLTNSPLRDTRKEYDENKEVYYLFREHPETHEISDKSYPRKFKDQLQCTLNFELKRSLESIDYQLDARMEAESVKQYLNFLSSEVKTLITHANANDALSKYEAIPKALHVLKERVEKIKTIYFGDLINDFSKIFSEKAKYSKKVIYTYLVYWSEYEGFSYQRAKAKGKMEEDGLPMPSDGTLSNWEQKWKDFAETRTES